MVVHHQIVILNGGVDAVPGWIVKLLEPGCIRRDQRQQHAAAQTCFGDALDILDRLIEIVRQDHPDPRIAHRIAIAEILEPAVMGLNSGVIEFKIFGPHC